MSDREVVSSFAQVHEAELVVSTLREAGIDAQVAPNTTTDQLLLGGGESVAVTVPRDQLHDARQRLAPPTEKRIVFLESVHAGLGRAIFAGAVAAIAAAVFRGSLPAWLLAILVVAPPLIIWLLAGSETRCSSPACHARIADERQCPACQGYVVGSLARGENHLAAEERWFAERGAPD